MCHNLSNHLATGYNMCSSTCDTAHTVCMSVWGVVSDYCSSLSPNDTYLIHIQLGRTAVMCAAVGGHTHTVEVLVGCGADINTQDRVS